MVVDLLAGDSGANELCGVSGAVQEAVANARADLRERGLVGVEALERQFWKEVLLPPSPIASVGLSLLLLLWWKRWL